jgi:PAS domain S-box-containing protein
VRRRAPGRPPAHPAIEAEARPTRRASEIDYRLRRRDGEYRWIFDAAHPRFTPSGTFAGYIGSSIDVTERRRTEQQVRAQHEFLRRVIDSDPNLVFAKDWNGRFTLANHAVAELYGTTVENLVGKTDADFNVNPAEIERFLRTTARSCRPEDEADRRGPGDRLQRSDHALVSDDQGARPAGGGRHGATFHGHQRARARAERLQAVLYRIAATTAPPRTSTSSTSRFTASWAS